MGTVNITLEDGILYFEAYPETALCEISEIIAFRIDKKEQIGYMFLRGMEKPFAKLSMEKVLEAKKIWTEWRKNGSIQR